MARVSRKQVVPVQTAQEKHSYNTCLYLRLSKEDSGFNNHDSIEMQEYLLRQYVKIHPDMILVAVFIDNGATGTTFERPGFEQMMDAVRKRELNCIIVKDLSRFGRNYIETGYYLEKIFPFLDIRFVAVNDGYDSLKSESGSDTVVSLKNIVNSLFAKDISKKISSALQLKQKMGEFIGSIAPYGYFKNPKDRHLLVIDSETAPVVIDIFKWRLEHAGYSEIAKRLNEQKIPCPSRHRALQGVTTKNISSTTTDLWCSATIKNITNNMVYAGHMAQHKQKRSLHDAIPQKQMEKRDWIIVRHTHEPIISEDIWLQVQEINQTVRDKPTQKLPGTKNILVGLVFCKDCQKTMARQKNSSKNGHIRYTYNCRTRKATKGMSGCTNKNIGEKELLNIIYQGVRTQIAATIAEETLLKKLSQPPYLQTEDALRKLQTTISKNTICRASLFENYKDELLTEEEYLYKKQWYALQANELTVRQNELQKKQIRTHKASIHNHSWISNAECLTKEMVQQLIHHITIEGRDDVHIVWNYKDEYETLISHTSGAGT